MMGAQEAYNSTANDDFDNDATTDRDFEMGERDDEELTVTAGASGGGSGTGALFPLARIKKIMKADKDVNLVAADAVNLVSLATELFVDSLVKKASDISQNEKRRTILYKDFAGAVKQDIRYSFVQELIPETVSIQSALEAQKHHGMVQSFTPAHSPVHDSDDHFDASFKSSASNLSSSSNAPASSASKPTDFFAKRTPSSSSSGNNVNFLLNSTSNTTDPHNDAIDISDDTY